MSILNTSIECTTTPKYSFENPRTVTVRLQINGRLTNAYHLIQSACTDAGIQVTRRQKGYSNKGELDNLVSAGLLEVRYSGPRGGQRWFATLAGIEACETVENKETTC